MNDELAEYKNAFYEMCELTKYKDAFEKMCRYYYSLMEGDDYLVENANKLMREFGLVDEEGFWIGVDDE